MWEEAMRPGKIPFADPMEGIETDKNGQGAQFMFEQIICSICSELQCRNIDYMLIGGR